jgi:hypothetical protein
MSEGRMKLNIGIIGENKPDPIPRQMTMKQAISFIKSRNFEPDIESELVKRVSQYPSNSLNSMLRNLPTMVVEITKKLREELNDGKK